jgi:epoxyqueuosine reductase
MRSTHAPCDRERREFLKRVGAAGAMLCFWPGRTLAQVASTEEPTKTPPFSFKYRTLSMSHLGEVQEWYEKLTREKKISENATYRSYLKFSFKAPEKMPQARSIVMVAYQLRLSSITCYLDGKKYVLLIPSGYADDGVPPDPINEAIAREVLHDPKGKLEPAALPCKILAVRSGLAEYGVNNITFVDGYGSFLQLTPYCVEEVLEDHWGPLKTMRICKGCSICLKACPTQAIRDENFVIDAGRCLSLYNERPEPYPDWISPKIHHTLVGCLKCQDTCPANLPYMGDVTNIGELTEAETKLLVKGERNSEMEKSIAAKLPWFPSARNVPYFSRATRLALANAQPV